MVAARRVQSASVILILTVLFVTGCVNTGSASPQVDFIGGGDPNSGDRSDCGEIYGTAFRSADERNWFSANCSRWPLVYVPNSPPAQNSVPLPKECIEQRGRAYSSEEQRRWYLENCLRDNNSSDGNTANSQQSSDRTNCDEIRGTPYRSPAEREWYLRNCGQPTTNSSQPGTTQTQIVIPSNNRGGNNNRGRGDD